MNKLQLAMIVLFVDFQGFADNNFFRILPIILFVFVFLEQLTLFRPERFLSKRPLPALCLMVLIVLVGIVSSRRPDLSIQLRAFKSITFLTFFLAYVSTVHNEIIKKGKAPMEVFNKYVFLPLLIFVSVNLGLYFIGLKSNDVDIGNGVILSYLGISLRRVEFFLSPGINAYGALLGILLNFSLIGVFILKQNKTMFVWGIVVAFMSLALTDSRGPIVFSIFILLFINFYYKRPSLPKAVWLVPIIGFIGPMLMLGTLALIAQTGYGDALSRSSEDLATGNARSIIWGIAFSDFLSFKPDHIFGYGEYGQYAGGLSQQWAYIFGDAEGAEFMHPHNTFLSIALDYGYVGLFVFVQIQFFIIKTIIKFWDTNRVIMSMLLANLLYFSLVGIGETLFGFYYRNIIYLFFMTTSFAFLISYFNRYKNN